MAESDQIRALRARYKESLFDKAQVCKQWLERISNAGWNEVQADELHGWLHQLAGSAGMYEYDEIAAHARSLMLEVMQSTTTLEQLHNQVDRLRALLHESAAA